MPGRQFVPPDTASRVLVGVGVTVLVVGLVVGTVAPAASVSGLGSTATTADQVNPASVGSESDLSAIQRQLAERLAQRARSGSLNLSGRDYQQIREQLNNSRYQELLSEYESVTSQTGNRNQSVAYRRMLNAQSAFVAALDRYETTYDRYQHLRNWTVADTDAFSMGVENARTVGVVGDPSKIGITHVEPEQLRRVAHKLERLQQRVNAVGFELIDRYQRLATISNENFTNARQSVHDQIHRIYLRQSAVERHTLVQSQLQVTYWTWQPSFTDPLTVSGRLTANGSAVANGTIRLTLGNQNVTTRTGSDGRFEIQLRPRTVSPDVEIATLRYVPEPEAITAASERTLPVNLTRVNATATVSVTPAVVGFGDNVTVSGRVTADDVGVGNTSVIVRAGGRFLGHNRTAANGTYNFTTPLPSRIPDGDQPVTVFIPASDSPIRNTSVNTTMTVVERTPKISISAIQADGKLLQVAGNVTANGNAVGGHSLSITINGTTVSTVRTDETGGFRTTVAVPSDLLDGGLRTQTSHVRVTVRSQKAANLAPANAMATATVTTGSTLLVVGIGVVAIALLAGAILAFRRWDRSESITSGSEDDPGDPTPDEAADGDTDDSPVERDPSTLVTAASDALGSDPERAVRVAYAALRNRLDGELDATDERRTHWEFYRDCQDADVDDGTLSTVRDVTEHYERVAYATETPTTETARETLDAVAALVDDRAEDSGRSGGSATLTED